MQLLLNEMFHKFVNNFPDVTFKGSSLCCLQQKAPIQKTDNHFRMAMLVTLFLVLINIFNSVR